LISIGWSGCRELNPGCYHPKVVSYR